MDNGLGYDEGDEFEATANKHIWRNKTNGRYYFADEGEEFNGPYTTALAAREALDEYVKHL